MWYWHNPWTNWRRHQWGSSHWSSVNLTNSRSQIYFLLGNIPRLSSWTEICIYKVHSWIRVLPVNKAVIRFAIALIFFVNNEAKLSAWKTLRRRWTSWCTRVTCHVWSVMQYPEASFAFFSQIWSWHSCELVTENIGRNETWDDVHVFLRHDIYYPVIDKTITELNDIFSAEDVFILRAIQTFTSDSEIELLKWRCSCSFSKQLQNQHGWCKLN